MVTSNPADEVFDPEAATEAVYDKVGKSIVNSVVGGYNGTVFCYGQVIHFVSTSHQADTTIYGICANLRQATHQSCVCIRRPVEKHSR